MGGGLRDWTRAVTSNRPLAPGVSAAFLVKNPPISQMAMLVEYLNSFYPRVVREIVIVDTGSPPDSIEIMLSWSREDMPVRLAEVPFEDFSQARNFGLRGALHEWTLVLDPDELPSPPMMEHILWATTEGPEQALGWLYWTVNYWAGMLGPEQHYHWHTRLFRTDRGAFYRPVHELVALDGKPESETRGTPLLPKAPRMAYLIHSKPGDEIAKADALYARLGEISR